MRIAFKDCKRPLGVALAIFESDTVPRIGENVNIMNTGMYVVSKVEYTIEEYTGPMRATVTLKQKKL